MKKTLLWVLGAGAALYFFSKMAFKNKANFLLQSVNVGGSFLAPKVLVRIAVQNPTNSQITLKSLSGSLSVNGKYLSNLSSFGDQVILPNSENVIELNARPSVIGVFNSIKELLTTPSGQLNANFVGTANVDGFSVPIDQTITI